MICRSIFYAAKPSLRSSIPVQRRTIATTVFRMGEGDTGAPRSGGIAASDSFNKREKASEDHFVRSKEIEKYKALKAKVAMQQQHLKELEEHIDDMSKDAGGEKN